MIRLQPVEFEWADSVGTESMVHGREGGLSGHSCRS